MRRSRARSNQRYYTNSLQSILLLDRRMAYQFVPFDNWNVPSTCGMDGIPFNSIIVHIVNIAEKFRKISYCRIFQSLYLLKYSPWKDIIFRSSKYILNSLS